MLLYFHDQLHAESYISAKCLTYTKRRLWPTAAWAAQGAAA